jgi:VWFA-related protein
MLYSRFMMSTLKITLWLCGLIVAILSSTKSVESQSSNKASEATRIRLDVEMVSLPVVVTNKNGKRIKDLKQEDFEIFENDIPQEIAGFASTDEPINVALMLDTSGSTEQDLARMQNAAIDFVHQLHPDDEVAILSFAEETKLQYDFTIDRKKNEYGIKKTRAGGGTAIYEAVWLALEEVLKPVWERKALVLFSDGVDTSSRKAGMNETLEQSKETGATIYAVYYDTEAGQNRRYRKNSPGYPGSNPPIIISTPPIIGIPGTGTSTRTVADREDYVRGRAYLEKLAENSGGEIFDGRSDLSAAFTGIAQELACQYSIGYYSTNTEHNGKFRKIQVKLKKPDLVARTKKGYYARKEKKVSHK